MGEQPVKVTRSKLLLGANPGKRCSDCNHFDFRHGDPIDKDSTAFAMFCARGLWGAGDYGYLNAWIVQALLQTAPDCPNYSPRGNPCCHWG